MSLRCEEVRDRFSALWENELSPTDQADVKGHLDLCPECREEFVRFDKTLRMLHSVEEVDVPDGFLAGVYEKLEDRKKSDLTPAKKGTRWLPLPSRWKLPVQAFAMVAVVFLALYVTKMTPVESPQEKVATEPKSALMEQKKVQVEAQAPVPREEKLDQLSLRQQENRAKKKEVGGSLKERAKTHTVERESRVAAEESGAKAPESPAMARSSNVPATPAPPLRKEDRSPPSPADKPAKMAQEVVARPEERGSGGRLDLRSEVMSPSPASGPKEGEPLQDARLMAKKAEEAVGASGTVSPRGKPSQELVLKVRDQRETRSRLEELMKRLGGEVLDARENRLLVALPGSSLQEFQNQMERIGSVMKKDTPVAASKETDAGLVQRPAAKRQAKGKDEEEAPLSFAKEGRTLIQIDLIEE